MTTLTTSAQADALFALSGLLRQIPALRIEVNDDHATVWARSIAGFGLWAREIGSHPDNAVEAAHVVTLTGRLNVRDGSVPVHLYAQVPATQPGRCTCGKPGCSDAAVTQ